MEFRIEDQPLYVVIQTPSCAEVTTDLCLLSEVPPNGQAGALRVPADAADNGRPLRLAPLGDLLLDRPQALDRAPVPYMINHGSLVLRLQAFQSSCRQTTISTQSKK